MCEAQK